MLKSNSITTVAKTFMCPYWEILSPSRYIGRPM